jgi:DNA-binding CsgD family transcriptional regulator
VKSGDQLVDSYFFHYVAGQTLQPADRSELRNQARLMVDSKLSDRKKQMLMLQWSGLNQSEIARKLGIERQAVSKALASIPAMFRLISKSRSRRQPN